ncbi:MAG: hypothetical protein KME64_05275 [Scytonematopsis contorta HA4267-MV1]|jgi:hypothetical protein|nr:hypothetical protein [Scytonematopsis contorta HA4267-MV1]
MHYRHDSTQLFPALESDTDFQASPDSTEITIKVTEIECLSEKEQSDRLHLEYQVARAFYQAGKALIELSSRKLYRSTHKTFEEYCKDKFGFERRYAYRLIEASRVIENLITMCPNWTQNEIENGTFVMPRDSVQVLPTNESQVRPLVPLEPEVQFQAWQLSVQETGGKVPSARLVKSIVEKIQQQTILPDSYKIGEVCQIIANNKPKVQPQTSVWGIITSKKESSIEVTTWKGECQVKIEKLKSLEYTDAECKYMQQLCQRLRRLSLVPNLDLTVHWLLSGLGKQLQPCLTPVQEKLLTVLEQEYNILWE